eukprot:jgi/Bigna1/68074/fgenesh1_pg.5_\
MMLLLQSRARRKVARSSSQSRAFSSKVGPAAHHRKLAPFMLERYFAKSESAAQRTLCGMDVGRCSFILLGRVCCSRHEFSAPYMLCSSDCEPINMHEVIEQADPEVQTMWRSLKLAYTESRGHPLLIEEICACYETAREAKTVTGVPQELIYLFMTAFLEKNRDNASGEALQQQRVIATYPGYQSLTEVAVHLGCDVDAWTPKVDDGSGSVFFDVDDLHEDNRQHSSQEALIRRDDGAQVKLLVINFPHNPTGCMLSKGELERVVALCREFGIAIFSDEMYRGLERNAEMTIENSDQLGCMTVFGMPGVRQGSYLVSLLLVLEIPPFRYVLTLMRLPRWLCWGEGDSHLDDCFERDGRGSALKRNRRKAMIVVFDMSSPGPSEILTIAGLRQKRFRSSMEELYGTWLPGMSFPIGNKRERLMDRCRMICAQGLEAIEQVMGKHEDIFSWYEPPGGSTAFPSLKLTKDDVDAEKFCELAVSECGVLLLPGECYDVLPGNQLHGVQDQSPFGSGRVRLGYGRSNAAEAATVLDEWLTKAKNNM